MKDVQERFLYRKICAIRMNDKGPLSQPLKIFMRFAVILLVAQEQREKYPLAVPFFHIS